MNEFAGFGLLSEMASGGIAVLEELSVVSFTSPDMAAIADPPLTITRSPGATLGALGVDAWNDHLEGPELTPPPQLLHCLLVPGGSTAQVSVRWRP